MDDYVTSNRCTRNLVCHYCYDTALTLSAVMRALSASVATRRKAPAPTAIYGRSGPQIADIGLLITLAALSSSAAYDPMNLLCERLHSAMNDNGERSW